MDPTSAQASDDFPTTTYIALLRGINVGAQKPIKMTELKQLFEAQGFGRVQTYIQSGNVVFTADCAEEPLRRQLEREIAAAFGFPVTVALRAADELERLIAQCPFAADALRDEESLYVSLLAEAPAQAGIDRLLGRGSDVDELRLVGREVYLLLRQSIRLTLFTNAFLERTLGVPATARNWRTISKLGELGRAMSRDAAAAAGGASSVPTPVAD
ncbi:MAG TPA: DUF1697 domain-containing protein [Ktedonobacterales bacterium]|nr:DUF1697 domain-containing protein [Ktedonobacterales bacterium]